MDADEAAEREAEHKAAALFYLGWENGAGATIWARVVQDQMAVHDSARERFAADTSDMETWERLYGSALVLVVAVDQVLAFEHRIRRITGDAQLAQARKRFDSVGPDAEALRDLISHLDEYAVGQGWRQQGNATSPIKETYLATLLYWGDGGATILNLGDEQVNLGAAAEAAVELARVADRTRLKHLQRVEEEANAAFRRRFGLPPE
jgi:hypothetical protein